MMQYNLSDLQEWFKNSNNYGRISRFVARFLYGSALKSPEDIAQETYLNAHGKIAQNGGSIDIECDNPETWIFTIAANLAKSEYRRTKRLHPREVTLSTPYGQDELNREAFQQAFNPETIDLKRLVNAVVAEVKGISGAFNDYMDMRMQGHTKEEIAKAYGVPVGTVKSRLHRGGREVVRRLAKKYPLEELLRS